MHNRDRWSRILQARIRQVLGALLTGLALGLLLAVACGGGAAAPRGPSEASSTR